MKLTSILLLIALITFSCKPGTGDTADQRLREENFALKKENDSLKALIEKSGRSYEGDTIQAAPATLARPSSAFVGKHNLTLQWISWDRPGSVMISPADGDWYNIKGSQTNNDAYLKIEGKIRPLNDRELEFDGVIEHNVHVIAEGEPCVRQGKQLFKATGTRKYWRLQNMLSCDGTTTDYVDIYF